MLKELHSYFNTIVFRRNWRKNNIHNYTIAMNIFDITKVSVGKHTYGPLNIFNDSNNKLVIGSYCSIAKEVMFLVGSEHKLDRFSTYPFSTYIFKENDPEAVAKGDIVVEDDVWIGYGATILSGVHIGQGAVIGARSVVTKDVEPYTIVGGNPAKPIRKRFDDSIIDELLKVDFSKVDKELLKKNKERIYKRINDPNDLSWLPRKDD